MATEVTVAPTLGHAVLFTQGGVGATPGYDAIDLRRAIEAASGLQEGVYDATGWRVRENTSGPNMTVQVDANVGLARVDGDSVAFQSGYVVAPHSGVITLDVAAAHSTNPRVDMVALIVRDNTHDALGQNDARVAYLTGTPTSGATLDNLNGSPSLPSNAIRLADVLVPAADTTISNSQLRDRRKWARGVYREIDRTGSDATKTAGVGFALIDATNWQPRIECSGRPLRVSLRGTARSSSAAGGIEMDVGIDGTAQGYNRFAGITGYPASMNFPIALDWDIVPSAGSHLIGPMWQADVGTATFLSAAGRIAQLVIEEHVRPNAANG